jgi:NADPH:quinone reductase-like Zn-dependent oxidoreductase
MRAIEFDRHGGPEVLSLVSRPTPVPDADEVIIEVQAVSMNPVDWKIRSGIIPNMPPSFPSLTGRDGAGIVQAAGANVDPSIIGRRVCFLAPRGQGTWADQISLAASLVSAIPDSLGFTEAAALPLGAVSAWLGLVESGEVAQGMRVLIHAGAGGVGSIAVQIARDAGAYVVATCSAANRDFVASLGANEVVAYDQQRFEESVRNMDLVLDLIGGDVHARSYATLRRGGSLVYLNAAPIIDQSAVYGVEVVMAQIVPDRKALDAVVAMVADGRVRVNVEKVLPFELFREAHIASQSGHARGKIVLSLR